MADTLVFNSQYNKNSFLENIHTFLKLIPDYRPSNLAEKLAPKCKVIPFPLSLPPHLNTSAFCKTMPGEQVEISDENLLTDKENSCLANSLTTDYLTSLQVDNCCPSSTQKRSLDGDGLSGFVVAKSSKLSNTDQRDENLQEKSEEKNANIDNITSVPQLMTESETRPLHIVWPHRW